MVIAVLLLTFAATAPFAARQLPAIHAYIPTIQALVFVTDLITAVLLLGHYAITSSRAVLMLAAGYLFSALMVVPYTLSFPGAFAPAGLFGGQQSTVWLYFFWHVGFPLAVIAYAVLKDGTSPRPERAGTAGRSEAGVAVALAVAVVCGLTLAGTWADDFLPRLMESDMAGTSAIVYAAIACSLASGAALAILWMRRRSILDLWLSVALCAGVTEPLLIAVFPSTRYSVGWYAARVYSVVTSTAVLGVLLSEMTILYARLSDNIGLLQRERRNRMMNVEAVVASITHEVRQPLSAIAANGSAALLFLDRPQPDIGEAREALNAILQDSFNASQVFDGICALVRSDTHTRQAVLLNEIVSESLRIVHGFAKQHGVTVQAELASGLPFVNAHRVQLQQVVLNLAHNAVDAMAPAAGRPKVLRVRTERRGGTAVALLVQDTGPGIDPRMIDDIFDPFVTTRPNGMGMGLAICRTIVERHGGRISARSTTGQGALFEVVLPAAAPDQPPAS